MRVGLGLDAHRFSPEDPGRRLVLGGVHFPGETGLAGHSDADVVCHALIDALLGAAAAGDCGALFPDSDPALEGADSLELLARTAGKLSGEGWTVVNVDAVIVAERPRIAPRVAEMREKLAGALGIAAERVSVKGTTTEGMGFTGRGEGIACQAVALLAFAAEEG
jgi:2-C-methyl-D-erythritol 2,4-cyclodiphosphate synthase